LRAVSGFRALCTSFLAVSAVFVLSGCATLFSSGPERVTIQSTPAGANVVINGVVMGATPVELQLKPQDVKEAVLQHPGFVDTPVELESSIEMQWVLLDFFGLYPLAVDAITGAWLSFDDWMYSGQLRSWEDVAWDLVTGSEKVAGYEAFIRFFPDSPHVPQARAMIRHLRSGVGGEAPSQRRSR
jgi:hypothetical protein